MKKNAIHITQESFNKEVLQSKTPVLVDFYADWCGPCRVIGPVIEALAAKYEGKLKVCKVNVDDAQDIALRYDISSIPSVLLFKNGEQVDQFMGALPQPMIEEFVGRHVK